MDGLIFVLLIVGLVLASILSNGSGGFTRMSKFKKSLISLGLVISTGSVVAIIFSQ